MVSPLNCMPNLSTRWDSLQYCGQPVFELVGRNMPPACCILSSSPISSSKKEAVRKDDLFLGASVLIGLFEKACHTNAFSNFRASNFLIFFFILRICLRIILFCP